MVKVKSVLLVLAVMAGFCLSGDASARPVNPATGWLYSVEMTGSTWKMEFPNDPYFLLGDAKSYPYKGTGLVVSDITQMDSDLMFVLGYGWPRFSIELMLGNRATVINWKETLNGTHVKDIKAEGLGGTLWGLRTGGTVWKGDIFSLGLGAFLAVSPNWRVRIWETPAGVEQREYMSNVPLSSYDSALVTAEGGMDLTASWALGAWVPWVALDARKVTSSIGLQVRTAGLTLDGKDYSLTPEKGSGIQLGVDWRFTKNALLRLAVEGGNPAGAFLSVNMCSGARL
jgi:hypothetical protein